ncbi:MAG: hypothetical protein QXZ44_06510 [Ferroplasma sp.]
MSNIKSFSYDEFISQFDNGNLNGIYVIVAGLMSYTGTVRLVDENSIIMDLPLKYYVGENVMYTPVVIGREEVQEIKEIPIDGHIEIDVKGGSKIIGDISDNFPNKITLSTENGMETVYYQDIVNCS